MLAFAALMALGTWQVERKAWKEGLIATLAERLAAPPTPLPPPAAWTALDPAGNEYRRVTFKAEFEPAEQALVLATGSAFRPDVTGPGYWIFAPARLAGGGVVVVNHGFVPLADAKTLLNRVNPRTVDITGTMRWPEAPNWFTPKADLAQNLWFVRNPIAIAAAKGWGPVSPFYVEQETPVPPGGWPRPGKLVPNLPNNHLQYAVTWYGLALVLIVVFVVWAAKTARERRNQGIASPK